MPQRNLTPSASIIATRRSMNRFSSFMFGMPSAGGVRPGFLSRSKTVTSCPRWLSWSAAARPDGPEPTMATRLPLLTSGICGFDPAVLVAFFDDGEFVFVDCDGLAVHSAGAGGFTERQGHTLPVNSGKLLVFLSLESACFQLPENISSFHSGMRLWSGQPLNIPPNLTPD